MSVELVRWEAPGPYDVAFSTRHGGVSEGEFASLNLGVLTDDEPERVRENRRRLSGAIGVDEQRLAFNRQEHGATVRRAAPAADPPPADGLVSDEPEQPLLALSADCLPLAVVRSGGDRPALAVLHAGWRGLLGGIVANGVRALGRAPLAAVVGPSIGPCCYAVAADVAEPFARAYGGDVVRGGHLDLWTSAERALRAAGVARIDRFDMCTACDDRFFSHRRDGGRTGRQGVLGVVRG